MSRSLRVVLLPPLVILMLGLAVAVVAAVSDISDVKHPDFLARFRLWGGLAFMAMWCPLLFSASAAISFKGSLSALSVPRYRAVLSGVVGCALLASAAALYSLLNFKPVWLGAFAAFNVLVIGGAIYASAVSRGIRQRT